MAFSTTGFNRVSNAVARATYGLNLQVIPGANIYVTVTSSNLGATIYSDALLSAVIPNSTVTADVNGNYSYYMPLNCMVTETISSPNSGDVIIPNIGINGPIVGSLTTTANTTDTVSITGVLATSHVSITPTNATAATIFGGVYVSAKAAGSITITHPATAGATFDLIITPY